MVSGVKLMVFPRTINAWVSTLNVNDVGKSWKFIEICFPEPGENLMLCINHTRPILVLTNPTTQDLRIVERLRFIVFQIWFRNTRKIVALKVSTS